MSADKNDTRVNFRPDGQDRDRLTLLIPVSTNTGKAKTSVSAKPLDDDKRLEAALAITELANASPQPRPRAGLLGPRTTALGLVKGLIPVPVGHPQALILQSLANQAPSGVRAPTQIFYGGLPNAHSLPMPRLKRKKRQPKLAEYEREAKQPRSKRKPTLKELIDQKKQTEEGGHQDSDDDDITLDRSLVLKPDALKAFMSWQAATSSSSPAPSPYPLNLSSTSALFRRSILSSSPSKSSIILQNPDESTQAIPVRILPEIPRSHSARQPLITQSSDPDKINLKLRSLSAVRSLYRKPPPVNTPPVVRVKRSRTALGSIMSSAALISSPPKTTRAPQPEEESASENEGNSPPASPPGSDAPSPAKRPSTMRIAQVAAESPSNNSSPCTPSAASDLQSKSLPPKKRKFFSESPPPRAPSPEHPPPTTDELRKGKRHAVDPGRNLVMLQELQAAIRADEDGDLPLHIAVVQGKLQLVGQLLAMMRQMGSAVDQHNALWQTPLHLAFITRQMAMVQKLLSAGASVNRADRHGHTALHLCVKHFDRPEDISEFLLSSDLNLNARNYEGLTALHLAVEGGHLKTVQLLIEHKVNINSVDGKGGRTPLFYACELNDKEMVQLLTHAGADVHLANYAGVTPVQVASNRRCLQIVSYLVEHGADNPTVVTSPEVNHKPASPQVKKCLKQSIGEKDNQQPTTPSSPPPQQQQQQQQEKKKEKKKMRQKREAERKTPSAIIIGETKALANITRSRTTFESSTGPGSPPIVLVASGSPDSSSDLEESVPSVKDVIEAMKVAMKRLGEGHPHFKVLKQRLQHFVQQNQQQPLPPREEEQDEEEQEERILPSIQLPSIRTSLRKKLRKRND